jgi:pyruvate ferredoxin oxidoreductase gamma subunit
MIEIRVHGRGGQGAVTSTELIAIAAIKPIRTREKVYTPDIVMVLDPTILNIVDVTAGLKKDGIIILNTAKEEGEVRKAFGIKAKMALVDATGIAVKHLGRPITNTTMLGALIKASGGALIKASGVVNIKSMKTPLKDRFGRIAEKNFNAMNVAYQKTG